MYKETMDLRRADWIQMEMHRILASKASPPSDQRPLLYFRDIFSASFTYRGPIGYV
jgi:hypothetical protein